MLSVSLFSCEDGDNGIQGDPGEQGILGIQGLPAPLTPDSVDLTEFSLFSENFENGNSLDITQLASRNSMWDTGVFNISGENAVIDENDIINIDGNEIIAINNSEFDQDIALFDTPNNQQREIVSTNLFFSGDISNNESTSVIITFENVEQNSVLLFDAYISSERNFDFLEWSINSQFVNGISGQSQNSSEFLGPFRVALELNAGVNELMLTYSKDGSVSRGFDSGAIDNIQILDLESYLEAIDEFENANSANLVSGKKLNSNALLYSNKSISPKK